jgi:hypothetical protein
MSESATERRHRLVLVLLGLGVGIWGVLIFFENAYFGAGFFGVSPPSWSAWIATLSFTELNLIDTLGVVLVTAGIILYVYWAHKANTAQRRRTSRNSRGAGAVAALFGLVLFVLFLALLVYVLYHYGGITLSSLWCSFNGFIGRSC